MCMGWVGYGWGVLLCLCWLINLGRFIIRGVALDNGPHIDFTISRSTANANANTIVSLYKIC